METRVVMWNRKCGRFSGKVFVPEGLYEGSLAVYRQGIRETEPVP